MFVWESEIKMIPGKQYFLEVYFLKIETKHVKLTLRFLIHQKKKKKNIEIPRKLKISHILALFGQCLLSKIL